MNHLDALKEDVRQSVDAQGVALVSGMVITDVGATAIAGQLRLHCIYLKKEDRYEFGRNMYRARSPDRVIR